MTFPLIDTKHFILHQQTHRCPGRGWGCTCCEVQTRSGSTTMLSWPCHTTRWRKASYRYCKISTPINISKTASQNFNVVNSRPNRSQAALYMWPTQIYLENINSADRYTCWIFVCFRYFYLPSLLWQSIQPVKTSVMKCWRGYLSGARCRLFAYCPADATASCNTTVSCPI